MHPVPLSPSPENAGPMVDKTIVIKSIRNIITSFIDYSTFWNFRTDCLENKNYLGFLI
jgi:hypothetical protein